MKHLRLFLILLSAVGLLASNTACSARQPTVKHSKQILSRYFKSYGKKYSETPYGQGKISAVELLALQEVHKNYVHVIADIKIENAPEQRVQVAVEKKLPTGWRVVGWESIQNGAAPAINQSPAE